MAKIQTTKRAKKAMGQKVVLMGQKVVLMGQKVVLMGQKVAPNPTAVEI